MLSKYAVGDFCIGFAVILSPFGMFLIAGSLYSHIVNRQYAFLAFGLIFLLVNLSLFYYVIKSEMQKSGVTVKTTEGISACEKKRYLRNPMEKEWSKVG